MDQNDCKLVEVKIERQVYIKNEVIEIVKEHEECIQFSIFDSVNELFYIKKLQY